MSQIPFRCGIVADPSYSAGRDLVETVKQALAGGVDGVQLRAKSSTARQMFEWAKALREVTRYHQAWLGVNDRLDVALAVGADAVHLGGHSLPVAEVKNFSSLPVGVSCHSVAEAKAAERGGSDYVILGPVFWTASKAEFGSPLGLDVLAEAARSVSCPLIAIGGITAAQAGEVMGRGASGVAVIGAIWGAEHVTAAAKELAQSVRVPALSGKP